MGKSGHVTNIATAKIANFANSIVPNTLFFNPSIRLNSTILKLIGYIHDGIREIIIFDRIRNIKQKSKAF